MRICFSGTDEDGNPTSFNSWLELAADAPWGQLDPKTFTNEQVEFLCGEFETVVPKITEGHGQERHLHFRPAPQLEGTQAFASRNLSIFRSYLAGELDPIAEAKSAANSYLESQGIDGLDTVIIPTKGSKKEWHADPNPSSNEKYPTLPEGNFWGPHLVRGDTLWGRLLTGDLPRYSHIWNSANILSGCFELELALKSGDVDAAILCAAVVGKSHGKLEVHSAKTAGFKKGPVIAAINTKAKNKRRDEWLEKLYWEQYRGSSDTHAARQLKRRLNKEIVNQELQKRNSERAEPVWKTMAEDTIRKGYVGVWKKADHSPS